MTNPTNNEEWSIEERVRMWFCQISPVAYPGKREFTATEELTIKGMANFIAAQISQAEQRGYERGCDEDNSDEILWKRMKEWNKEWQDENPKERSLTWQDALKLIEWKIEKAEQRGKREGLEEAKELLSDHYFDSLQHEKGMILFHTDAVIDQALKKLNQ